MKSFGKTFRAILALSMALCMVMSCVTVSADAVTLTQIGSVVPSGGYYQAVYKVSGISAENGNATILVHSGAAPTNETIEYANQMPVTGGEATFTMLLDNGNYTILAGGTGFATAAYGTTLTAGSAPTISATPVEGVKDDQADAVVANIVVEDADSTQEVSNIDSVAITAGNDNDPAYFAVSGNTVVTVGTVPANTYPLTLTVTDKEGLTGTCNVSVVIETSVITVAEYKTSLNGDLDWNQTLTYPEATEYVNINGVSYKDEWSTEDNATYKNTVVLPSGYQFSAGVTEMEVSYTVNKIDTRTVVELAYKAEYPVEYGDDKPEFEAITFINAETKDVVEIPAENVEFASEWVGEEFDSTIDGGKVYTYTKEVTLSGDYKFVDGLTATATVTVTVNDQRKPVYAPTNISEIEVGFGKGIPSAQLAAIEAGEGLKFVGEWTCEGFNDKVADTYVFINTVALTDTNAYKLVGSADVSVNVIVKDDRQVVTDIEIVNEAINVPYGTAAADINFSNVTATYVVDKGEAPIVEIGAWTAPEEYADGTVVGTHTFTATILNADNDVYKIDASVAKEITVIVNVAKKDIIVTGYSYEATKAFNYGEVGEYTLPGQVDVVAEDYAGKFNVTWDKEFSQAAGTVVYKGTVAVPDDAVYNFDASTAEAPVITVTINYVIDGYEFRNTADGEKVSNIFVESGTDLDTEIENETLPKFVVIKDGDVASEAIAIEDAWWSATEDFPAEAWASAPITLTIPDEVLGDNWTWGDAPMAVILEAITKGAADFVVTVDGYNKKYVASLNDQPATITIGGINGVAIPGLATENPYKFDVDGVQGEWQADNSVVVVPVEGTSKHTVVATVKLQDGTEESQTVYINKYSTLFNGSVYINDTANEEEAYSAVRANKNREITVSHDFTYSNDSAYSFAGNTKVEVYKATGEGLELFKSFDFEDGAKSVVIPASETATWGDASYRFVVTYDSEDELVGTKTNARYVYVSNNGTWYNSFLINGLSKSGIVIRNSEKLTNNIMLTDLGAAGKAWIAHSLNKYNDNSVVYEEDYKEVTDKDYSYERQLTAEEFANNATYKFYTTLKLDSESDILDMNIGRVVYIYKQVTAVTNVAVNGSCNSGPVIKDGKLEFKPYWYKDSRKNEFNYETLTYKLTFLEGVDAEAFAAAVHGGVVDGTTVTFTEAKGADATSTVTIDASVFAERVKAELVVEIDGVEDARVSRVFWPQAE